MTPNVKLATNQTQKAWVHCPICTNSVEAEVLAKGKHMITRPGQKCSRCASLNVRQLLTDCANHVAKKIEAMVISSEFS